jgi:O-antigen/teichoic acid export membrane protein
LGIVLSYFNLISNDTLTNNLFIYYCLSIPLLALNNLLVAYYQALKAFKKVSVLLIIARIIHVAIIISLTYLFGINGFITGIILGFLISTLLLISKTEFIKNWNKTTAVHFKKNWELAKYAFLGNTINTLSLYLDIFFLNHLVNNPKEIGFYSFALTLIAGLRILTYTAQQFVTPFYSEFSSNDAQILKAFKKSNKIFGITILAVGIVSVLVVPLVIHFLFSEKYDASMYYFQVLTLSWVIRSWVSLKGPFLLAIGHLKITFKMAVVVFIITTVPYWYLVKIFQVQGALWGQVFVAVISLIVVNVGFKKVINKVYKTEQN